MGKKHSLGRMLVFGAITGALGGIAAYKHRKAIERTLQDIADQMDAWEDESDFFHDDDTVVHTIPRAEEPVTEAAPEEEAEEAPVQPPKTESEAPEAEDSDFAAPETEE